MNVLLITERNGPQALVDGADAALYEAKRTGRNRVVVRRPDSDG